MNNLNKNLVFTFAAFTLAAQKAFCLSETVSPELDTALKTHSNEPSFLTIVFALLFVVFLIYITGLIYSKLNIVGAKTVQSQLKNHDLSRVVVLSTTQLGPAKNLHVIELNGKRFLIGATQNSINLLKELEDGQDAAQVAVQESAPADIAEPKVVVDPMQILYGKPQDDSLEDLKAVEEFDVHKKYL